MKSDCNPINSVHAEQQRLAREWELFATEASRWVCECGCYCNPSDSMWKFDHGHWLHYHGFPVNYVRAGRMQRQAA